MRIILSDTGKRFNRDWIFRHLNFEFSPGKSYAVTGPNGSGKSTLLQVLSSSIENSEGSIEWLINEKKAETDQVYKSVSIAAPYLEVIEEMTVSEFLSFHGKFKKFLPGITLKDILTTVGLEKSANKQIRYYSSGMKQRVKLAQAIFTEAPLLLLDEPCTNLDESGYTLYHDLIGKYCTGKTIIVSSNDINEYSFCREKINISDFK